MTDNEIVKALRNWLEEIRKARQAYSISVGEEHYPSMKYEYLLTDAIREINRLQAEIEGSKNENTLLSQNSLANKYPHCVWIGDNLILSKSEQDYDKLIANIKAEAYKEFAEKLKGFQHPVYHNDPNKKHLIMKECVFLSEIDNLLKELVGEQAIEECEN